MHPKQFCMSIQDSLDEQDVVGRIRLELPHPSSKGASWIIVEGESDEKFFSKIFSGEKVNVRRSYGGLSKLIHIVNTLIKQTRAIIGIRDADFLHLDDKYTPIPHIFLTDYHDLEMMTAASDTVYESVVIEYAGKENLSLLDRETILRSISFIGGLRWLNDRLKLRLNFQGMGLAEFYDGEHQSLNKADLLSKVQKRSPDKRGNANIRDIEAGIAGVTDYLNLCNGHDFHKALASCIRSCGRNQVHDKAIAAGFRMTYRFQDFQESRLYEELKEWADKQSISLFSA